MQNKISASLLLSLLLGFTTLAFAQDKIPAYNKGAIATARFGDKIRQENFNRAARVREAIGQNVIGQDEIAAGIEIHLIQYLESLGSRKEEPVAMHFIGLPGIGKTSIIEVLRSLGLPVVRLDAQTYPAGENNNSEYYLKQALTEALKKKEKPDSPLILFIDEIDKVPEIKHDGGEQNQPVIAALNQILSEGKTLDNSNREMDFSNVLILTAMNFSSSQIGHFSNEILQQEKSFWDFSTADMAKFDDWIRGAQTGPAASAKVMSTLFRTNTIGRMITDTIVAKALSEESYEKIARQNLAQVLTRLTPEQKRVSVSHSPEYLDFLYANSVFAPSGARMTVKRVDLLTEQLMSIGLRADLNKPNTLTLPREVNLSYDPEGKMALVDVRAFKSVRGVRTLEAEEVLRVPFNESAGSFEFPQALLKILPASIGGISEQYTAKLAAKRFSKKQIEGARAGLFEETSLEDYLNSVVFDQEDLIHDFAGRMRIYMNAVDRAVRFQTILGFSGVGKSAMVLAAAAKLDIPVVKMNLQEYSGDSQEAVDKFGGDLISRIEKARKDSKNGKYILLFEEADKAFEVAPDGSPVTRPALAVIKDLLDKGSRIVTLKTPFGSQDKLVDIQDAYTVLTMNFPTSDFDLKADPRITTIEDMLTIHKKLSGSIESLNNLLLRMFLVDTVNRLLSDNLSMARPLTEVGYQKILRAQVPFALRDLNSIPNKEKHFGAITVEYSDAYFNEYLMKEAVVPSLGGRPAETTARSYLAQDTIEALRAVSANSSLRDRPVRVHLDYKALDAEKPARVLSDVRLSDSPDIKDNNEQRTPVTELPRSLRFPPNRAFGKMTAQRLLVAGHEFGHAYAMMMYGRRFEFATAVSPIPGIGGMVKTRLGGEPTGKFLLAKLLGGLGARAMERLLMNPNPRATSAVFNVTAGASSDIAEETRLLWNLVHTLGMDPGGGLIERGGLAGPQQNKFAERRYFFSELPDLKIEQLGLVLRDLEDYLVGQMADEQNLTWYAEKIASFAADASLTEAQFYALVEHPFPGENLHFLGEQTHLENIFAKYLEAPPAEVVAAREFKQGKSQRTAADALDDAAVKFMAILDARLHPCATDLAGGSGKNYPPPGWEN